MLFSTLSLYKIIDTVRIAEGGTVSFMLNSFVTNKINLTENQSSANLTPSHKLVNMP